MPDVQIVILATEVATKEQVILKPVRALLFIDVIEDIKGAFLYNQTQHLLN